MRFQVNEILSCVYCAFVNWFLFSFYSDPSVLKRPLEKESSVYVIEEHLHRHDALSGGLFATEV